MQWLRGTPRRAVPPLHSGCHRGRCPRPWYLWCLGLSKRDHFEPLFDASARSGRIIPLLALLLMGWQVPLALVSILSRQPEVRSYMQWRFKKLGTERESMGLHSGVPPGLSVLHPHEETFGAVSAFYFLHLEIGTRVSSVLHPPEETSFALFCIAHGFSLAQKALTTTPFEDLLFSLEELPFLPSRVLGGNHTCSHTPQPFLALYGELLSPSPGHGTSRGEIGFWLSKTEILRITT